MTDVELTIFETLHWKVLLRADDQTYLGRAAVVCKRLAHSIPELTDEEWADLKRVIARYEAACKQTFGATMFNWSCLMNEAYQHQPPVPHVHWHVRPRYMKPVTLAGLKFTDEKFGHHYERKTNREVSDQAAKEIIAELKKPIAA